jgi:Brp/Blh family beta-carotene 15,15'-monooxygenase
MIALPQPRRGWVPLAMAAALLCAAPPLPVAWQLLAVVPAIVIFGLPHGAADWWLAAASLRPRLPGWTWVPAFGLAYLAVSLATALAILAAPSAMLVAFVLLSAWHFGSTDLAALRIRAPAMVALCTGLTPIAAPLLLHQAASQSILASLGVALAPDAQHLWAGVALAIAVPGVLTAMAFAPPRARRALAAEQAAMLALAAAAPPLLAFLVYFCVLHAPRQTAAQPVGGPAAHAWLGGIGAALLIGGALVLIPHQAHAAALAMRGLFWGLAVLTIPHVLTGWLLRPDSGNAAWSRAT